MWWVLTEHLSVSTFFCESYVLGRKLCFGSAICM